MLNCSSVESFKVKGRKIVVNENNFEAKIIQDYIIPHGIHFSDEHFNLLVDKNKPLSISLVPKDVNSRLGIVHLFPYFKKTNIIKIKNVDRKIHFWQVINDRDKFNCEMLISNFHHQSIPSRGAILACKLPEIKKSIIGCAYLYRMTYTSAIKNRSELLNVDPDNLKEMSRRDIVNGFGISWASRFVVHPKYRNLGIGKMLADVLKEMAALYYVPSSNFIEVYATMPISLIKKQGDEDRNNNFLIKSGYKRKKDYSTPSTISFEFDEDGYKVLEKGKRFYYYCDVRSFQNRLFVPLNSETYIWFLEKNKKWEVRNYKGAFTLNNLHVGKKVELRRGYSDKESSLWGIIQDIKRFDSIHGLFSNINFKKIIPIAKDVKDAIEYSRKYLRIDKTGKANIIAIKILF